MDRHNCTDTISGVMYDVSLPLSWRGWLADGKRLLAVEVLHALTTVRVWRRRAHSRRQIEHLDEHLRRDIGLTREQLRREATKPFWKK